MKSDTGAVLATIARLKGIPTEPAIDVWQTAGEHVAARGGVLQPWAELAALPNPGPLDLDDDLVTADRAAAAIATAGNVAAGRRRHPALVLLPHHAMDVRTMMAGPGATPAPTSVHREDRGRAGSNCPDVVPGRREAESST